MNPEIISYKTLRKVIGVLALSISIVCIFGAMIFGKYDVQSSVSAYYYTNMRDFLEAVMIGIGTFLVCYYGYTLLDRIINTIAGVFCMCIAFFPTSTTSYGYNLPVGIFQIDQNISNILHLVCASIFFALLSFISIFLFTKTAKKIIPTSSGKYLPMTKQKKIRNIIYIVCGIIIAACGVSLGLCFAFLTQTIMDKYYLVLIFEIIILTAFGVSWLVKGEAILGDKKYDDAC